VKKIERNIERDAMNTEALEQSGWQVMRFWESDIHQDVDSVVEQIRSVLQEQARSSNR
jgi:DNA mismatch endonuclease (patch repair protein)